MVLFTEQIFKNSIRQNSQPSICFKTRGRVQEKTKSLNESLKISAKCLKSLSEWLKNLAMSLWYDTAHGVRISHGKEE